MEQRTGGGSGDTIKALFGEMFVEGKGTPDTKPSHQLETDTVNQTELTPGCRQEGGYARLVCGIVHPFQADDWQYILVEGAYSIHFQPILYQGRCLNDDVVAGNQWRAFVQQGFPNLLGRTMLPIIGIEECIKC
jgi:hypothetical protein